jgi:sterol desaturase/sphingolipid hydroxylase (fatty acid hydroxylase superfamily)
LFLFNTLVAHDSVKYPKDFHVLHHSFFHKNFGAGLHLMDRLFNTYIEV